MKKDIHPVWHDDCQITCSCGHQFTTGSVKESIAVDICSQCHPFFTGEMRFVDIQGRVEKFKQKREQAKEFIATQKERKVKKVVRQQQARRTLKEVLTDIKTNQSDTPEAKTVSPSKS